MTTESTARPAEDSGPSLLTLWRREAGKRLDFHENRGRVVGVDNRIRAVLGGNIPDPAPVAGADWWHPLAIIEALLDELETVDERHRKLIRLINESCERVRRVGIGVDPSPAGVTCLPDLARYTVDLLGAYLRKHAETPKGASDQVECADPGFAKGGIVEPPEGGYFPSAGAGPDSVLPLPGRVGRIKVEPLAGASTVVEPGDLVFADDEPAIDYAREQVVRAGLRAELREELERGGDLGFGDLLRNLTAIVRAAGMAMGGTE